MSNNTLRRPTGLDYIFYNYRLYLIGLIAFLCMIFLAVASNISFAAGKTTKLVSASKKSLKKSHPKLKRKSSLKPSRIKRVKPVNPSVQAKAAYCVNLANNETLISKNADEKLPIASLTKLVTALVTLDHMPLDKEITVPDHIKKVPKSVIGLKPGDTLTVRDLLHGMLISSGNDCAESLACAYPGGKDKFIEALNAKAKSLGVTNTKFFTPSGLDKKIGNANCSEKEEEVEANVSTAREIATIARIAFSNKVIQSICRKKSYVITSKLNPKGYSLRSTNKLLRDKLPVVSGKTGFTVRAGHCLASEFSPGNDLLVIVVLGSPNHFRDTRLLYLKALKQTNTIKSANSEAAAHVAAK